MNKQNQWLFEVPPVFEITESSFGLGDGEWEVGAKPGTVRRPTQRGQQTRSPASRSSYPKRQVQRLSKGVRSIPRRPNTTSYAPRQSSQSPLPPARPLTYADVRSDRIDVFAQRALLRMSKNPATSADAAAMADAVKSGVLGGIYKEDEKVPALRARKMNSSWWLIIPKQEDAVLFLDPEKPKTGTPIIVFRDRVRSDPTKLDPALQTAWRSFKALQRGRIGRCSIERGRPRILAESGQIRQEASVVGNVVPPMCVQPSNTGFIPIRNGECNDAFQRVHKATATVQAVKFDVTVVTLQFNPLTKGTVASSGSDRMAFSCNNAGTFQNCGLSIPVNIPAWAYCASIEASSKNPLEEWEYGFIQTVHRSRILHLYSNGEGRECTLEKKLDGTPKTISPWYSSELKGLKDVSSGELIALEDSPSTIAKIKHKSESTLVQVCITAVFGIWVAVRNKRTREITPILFKEIKLDRTWILKEKGNPSLPDDWVHFGGHRETKRADMNTGNMPQPVLKGEKANNLVQKCFRDVKNQKCNEKPEEFNDDCMPFVCPNRPDPCRESFF